MLKEGNEGIFPSRTKTASIKCATSSGFIHHLSKSKSRSEMLTIHIISNIRYLLLGLLEKIGRTSSLFQSDYKMLFKYPVFAADKIQDSYESHGNDPSNYMRSTQNIYNNKNCSST